MNKCPESNILFLFDQHTDDWRVRAFSRGPGGDVGLFVTEYMHSKSAAVKELKCQVRRLDEAKTREYEMDRNARTRHVSRGRSLYRR
jgi:hypothetical protein